MSDRSSTQRNLGQRAAKRAEGAGKKRKLPVLSEGKQSQRGNAEHPAQQCMHTASFPRMEGGQYSSKEWSNHRGQNLGIEPKWEPCRQ